MIVASCVEREESEFEELVLFWWVVLKDREILGMDSCDGARRREEL